MRRATLAVSAALITLGAIGSLADRSLALPLSNPRVHDLAIAGSPMQKAWCRRWWQWHGARWVRSCWPAGYDPCGYARGCAPQRGTTRIGALGEGRPPIGIGSTDRPRLLRVNLSDEQRSQLAVQEPPLLPDALSRSASARLQVWCVPVTETPHARSDEVSVNY
jgi:hypothetical protein